MGKKLSLVLVLALVAALVIMLGASSAFALPTLGTDCYKSGCHAAGQPPSKATVVKPEAPKAAEPAKAAEPTKAAEPAKAAAPAPAKVSNKVTVKAFGRSKDFTGTVIGGKVYLPVRPVAEFFGAVVNWDAKARAATVTYWKTNAVIDLKSGAKIVNGQLLAEADALAKVFGSKLAGSAIESALPGYAGSQTCGACHADTYKEWKGTRHARMLQDAKDPNTWWISNFNTNTFFKKEDVEFVVGNGMEGGQRYIAFKDGKLRYMNAVWNNETRKWDAANPSDYTCASCHTAGFNKESNSWAENGITCESCHGPGAEHAKAPSKANIKSNLTNDMCRDCHGGYRQVGQMETRAKERETGSHFGIFAYASVAEASRYWDSRCFRCHSASYKVAEAKGEPLPTKDDFLTGALKDDRVGITCAVCHDPHKSIVDAKTKELIPFQLRKDETETCLQCHQSSSPVTVGKQPHHPQKEMWEGNIYKGDGTMVSVPFSKEATCADCHMAEYGNHGFYVGAPTKEILEGHGRKVVMNSCSSCHAEMTAAEVHEIQEGFEAKYTALDAQLQALNEKFKAADDATKAKVKPYLDALTTNLYLFHADASEGIHNVKWARAMFAQAEADIAVAKSLLP